jgi:hypothetical protein
LLNFTQDFRHRKTQLKISSLPFWSFGITAGFSKAFFPVLAVYFTVFFSACREKNEVPAYIHVPSFTLEVVSGQGSSTQKITDAWVYLDGQVNGVYPLPITFPIVEVGSRRLEFFPGIRNNGSRGNPIIYPFYDVYKVTKVLESGKIDTIRPVVRYANDVIFKVLENFEGSNPLFTVHRDNASANGFVNLPEGFEGKAATITLNKDFPILTKLSSPKVSLPESSNDIFLEMNYKTEAPLAIGLFGTGGAAGLEGREVYKITLFASKEWNKTYINLTNEVKNMRAAEYQILIRSALPDSVQSAKLRIDNIKLIQR